MHKLLTSLIICLLLFGCAGTSDTRIDSFDGKKRVTIGTSKIYKDSVWEKPNIWANGQWSESTPNKLILGIQLIGEIPKSTKLNIDGHIIELKTNNSAYISSSNMMQHAAGEINYEISQELLLEVINSKRTTIRVTSSSGLFSDGVLTNDAPESFIRAAKKLASELNWL